MSFSIKPLPVHAIILSTLHRDFDPIGEMVSYVQHLRSELDHAPQPTTFIAMVDEVEVGSGGVMTYLAGLTRGERAVVGHPNVRSIIVVTTNDLISYEAEKVEWLPVTVTRTLAEAIAQAG